MQAISEVRLADRETDESVALVDRHRVAEEAMARRETSSGDRRRACPCGRRKHTGVIRKSGRALPELGQERRISRRDQIGPQAVAYDNDDAVHSDNPPSIAGSRARMRSRKWGDR